MALFYPSTPAARIVCDRERDSTAAAAAGRQVIPFADPRGSRRALDGKCTGGRSMIPDEAKPGAPQAAQMIQVVWGFMATQSLHVAAKLGIPDVLSGGPMTPHEVAAACSAKEYPLRRLMRFLTGIGVLTEDERGRFSCTALGDFLRSDHPQSVRNVAIMYGEPFWWRSWGDLYETVKTGQPAFDRVHGEPFFDYLAHTPVDAAIFNAGMTSGTNVDVGNIVAAYDFSRLKNVVDVAGGHGALLRGILERYPACTGVLCDLPSVIAGAADLRQSAVAARCELVPADIFQSVPSGGDAYILKRILHDWNDDKATQILENCRRAVVPGGRVLVMEQVVKASNQPDPAKWMDLNMLVMLTGRERTEAEFGELYARAGFRLTGVIPASRLSIVEGVAV
jgi:SAM-dependent methyltransferase